MSVRLARADERENRIFQQGFVCAVATMVAMHDEPSMAEELLHSLGPVNWRHITQYDKDILKRAKIVLRQYSITKGVPA